MAMIYCRECGKQISDQAPFCPNCGIPQNIQATIYPIYAVKPKIPGRGFSITSMVMGLIASFNAFVYIVGAIKRIQEGNSYFRTISEKLEAGRGFLIFAIIFSVLALSFGIASHEKASKSKKKTAGIIMGILSLTVPLLVFIIGTILSN
ncbi:MAG: zinc ribbon domain-containing protein [Ruminococcaceae bacterium]|nr:zinc ribbon domain-containing protein [Oscillospiraceae bacterium]